MELRGEWKSIQGGYQLDEDLAVEYEGWNQDPKDAGLFKKSYDLAKLGYVTPVRKQVLNNCWTYAALAAIESYLLKKEKKIMPDKIQADLSEMHMTYAMLNMDTNGKYNNPWGKKPKAEGNYSGNRMMAAAYLTRGMENGVASEIDDPTFIEKKAEMKSRYFDITKHKSRLFYVSGIRYIEEIISPTPDPQFIRTVKACLMEYGAVACAIYYDEKYLNENTSIPREVSYWCPEAQAQLSEGNHAVTIVGWDDNYGNKNFKPDKDGKLPKNSGAFKIKDSNGTVQSGSETVYDGYFWISYEDCNIKRAYCITDVQEHFFDDTYKIYHHDIYGMGNYFRGAASKEKVTMRNVYTAQAGEKLEGVGMYAYTRCMADIVCKSGGKDIEVARDFRLLYPGYHTYWLSTPLDLKGGEFQIEICYRSIYQISVFAPVEFKMTEEYNNIQVDSGKSFINNEDLKLIQGRNDGYSYVPVRAIVKDYSPEAIKRKQVFDALSLPEASKYRIDNLPSSRNGIRLEWRMEPYLMETYGGKAASVKPYTIDMPDGGVRIGFINTGAKEEAVRVCAVIGDGDNCLHKIMETQLLGFESGGCLFTCSEVKKYDLSSDISGAFEVPGAVIKVTANGMESTAIVNAEKTWKIENFQLYDKYKGWNDSYINTEVKVSVYSKENIVLASGTSKIGLEKPYDESGGAALVMSAVGFIVAIGSAITYILIKGNFSCTSAAAGGAAAGESFTDGNKNLMIDGKMHEVRLEDFATFTKEAKSLRNLNVVRHRTPHKSKMEAENLEKQKGGIAGKITKGGEVINCTVRGVIDDCEEAGGLFYEGEDVTVKQCKVDLEIEARSSGAGLAVRADGIKASNCTVSGSMTLSGNSAIAGGLVADLRGNAQIEDCRSSVTITGVKNGGGIAGLMSGDSGAPSINRCLSVCRISGIEKESRVCGIAPGIDGREEAVQNSISICSKLSGAKAARVSFSNSKSCVAFDGILCGAGQAFESGNEKLNGSDRLREKETYTGFGFDTDNIWGFHEKNHYLFLKDCHGMNGYDYPFACPYAPKEEGFIFPAREMIAMTGNCSQATDKVTWDSLSPVNAVRMGNQEGFLCRNGAFYFEFAALPIGTYTFRLVAVQGEEKYYLPMTIQIE